MRLAWRIQGLVRLTTQDAFDPDAAPLAIKALLAREVADATDAYTIDYDDLEGYAWLCGRSPLPMCTANSSSS